LVSRIELRASNMLNRLYQPQTRVTVTVKLCDSYILYNHYVMEMPSICTNFGFLYLKKKQNTRSSNHLLNAKNKGIKSPDLIPLQTITIILSIKRLFSDVSSYLLEMTYNPGLQN
jgi:hypothetical protein